MSAGRQLLGTGPLGEMSPDTVPPSLGMKAGGGRCCRAGGSLMKREVVRGRGHWKVGNPAALGAMFSHLYTKGSRTTQMPTLIP